MDYLNRQSGLITNEERKLRITIIGVGGIGSHTALALARMGFHDLTLIDDDAVSLQNCSSQGFDMGDVGSYKVDVMRQKIMRAVRCVPTIKKVRIDSTSDVLYTDVLIMAVDSMQARKEIFDVYFAKPDHHLKASHVINPSMGGEYMNIDCYDGDACDVGDESKAFADAWFTDDEGLQETCTTKATIYTTLLIAGTICKIVKDIATQNDYVKNITYDIKNNTIIHSYNNKGEEL